MKSRAPGLAIHSLKTILPGAFLAIIIAMTLLSFGAIGAVRGAYLELAAMQSVQRGIVSLRTMAADLMAATDNYLQTGNETYKETSLAAKKLFDALLVDLEKMVGPGYRLEIRDIRATRDTFMQLSQEVSEDLAAGIERIYIDRRRAELRRYMGYVDAECGSFLDSYMRQSQLSSELLGARVEQTGNAAYLVSFLIAFLFSLLALRIANTVADPVFALAGLMGRFASGELDLPTASEKGPAEIGLLARSFNSMTPKIKRLVEVEREKTALAEQLREEGTRMLELENSMRMTELELLQARINPHFIFNTLASIASLAQLEEAGRTVRSVNSLARIMRYSLTADKAAATIGEELETVRHYLALQKIRFNKRLKFQVQCSDAVSSWQLPGLSVQPFVENAIIHGIEPKESGGSIMVEALEIDEDTALIRISDDGVGFDPAYLYEHEADGRAHYGIANVSRRLELLYGKNTVRVASNPGSGTSVELRISAATPQG
jgi:nitrate/nitrite-specific signal transduction histidine kinase